MENAMKCFYIHRKVWKFYQMDLLHKSSGIQSSSFFLHSQGMVIIIRVQDSPIYLLETKLSGKIKKQRKKSSSTLCSVVLTKPSQVLPKQCRLVCRCLKLSHLFHFPTRHKFRQRQSCLGESLLRKLIFLAGAHTQFYKLNWSIED